MNKKGLTVLLLSTVVCMVVSCQTKGEKAPATETDSVKVKEEVPVQKVDIAETDTPVSLKAEQQWMDGFASYTVKKRGDSFFFFGGTTHEGGYTFGLQPQDDGSYRVKKSNWSMLNDGMTIPVSACALLKAWDESIISPRSNHVRLLPTGRKNYHRIIHKNNPHFNRKKFQFEFQNGEVLRLQLYEHLKV